MKFNYLCFALLFICICNSLAEPVYDINGEELRTGSRYYIVSAKHGAGGGGLTLSNYRNKPCPTTVSQEVSSSRLGLPVTFSLDGSEEGEISVSSPVNIAFADNLPCATSGVWKVGKLDAYTRSVLLEIGGEEGSEQSSFKIENGSYQSSYQISDARGENYLSIRSAFGQRPVALSSQGLPFQLSFVKADDRSGNGHQSVLKMMV